MAEMQQEFRITLRVLKGGFILEYPVPANAPSDLWYQHEEVFVSPRKLNQKIKEVIESVGLVKDDE
jgi:hypothetical protein